MAQKLLKSKSIPYTDLSWQISEPETAFFLKSGVKTKIMSEKTKTGSV